MKHNASEFKIRTLTKDTIESLKENPKLFSIFLKSNPGFIEEVILKFISKDSADFEDYYQMGCIALWKALHKFNAERTGASKFSTYAYTLILHDAIQEIKKSNKRNYGEMPIETLRHMYDNELSSEYNEALFKETAQTYMCRNFESITINRILVRDKLQEFGDIEQKVFHLKFFENLSIRECAEKLGINQHTLKQLFYRKVYPKAKDLGRELAEA